MPTRPRRPRQPRAMLTPRLELDLSIGPADADDNDLARLRVLWAEWGAWVLALDTSDPGWRPWAFWQFEAEVPERLRGPVSKLAEVLDDLDVEREVRGREDEAAERLDAARRAWLAERRRP